MAAALAAETRHDTETAEPAPRPRNARAHAVDDKVAHDDAPWTREIERAGKFGKVGQTLVDRGLITTAELDDALALQRSTGKRVGETLVEIGVLSQYELTRVLADHLGVPFVDLESRPPDPMLVSVLPEDVARRYKALPVTRWNGQLVVAMANPSDLFVLDDLHMMTGHPIVPAMADEEHLAAAIDRVYQVSAIETTLDAAASDYEPEGETQVASSVDENEGPVIGLVNALLEQAIADRASDLHVEPNSQNIAIRVRIDGVLHDSSEVPLSLLRPLVSRMKILGDLDIAQTRHAQDGRFSLKVNGRPIDVRVVTVPTAAGETVVLRLLDPVRERLDVSSLGLTPEEEARFIPSFMAPQGAVFVTGPTGSGKTSTVYAVLSQVNTRTKSIVSVEDPVEYRLDGVKQIQINPRREWSSPTRSARSCAPIPTSCSSVRCATRRRRASRPTRRSPATSCCRRCTRPRRVGADAARRHGSRALPRRVRAHDGGRAATCPPVVRDVCPARRRSRHRTVAPARRHRRDPRRREVLHAVGCPACRNTGYRARPAVRDHAGHRGDQSPHRRQGVQWRHRASRRRGRHGDVADRGPAPHRPRRAQHRRDDARDRVGAYAKSLL